MSDNSKLDPMLLLSLTSSNRQQQQSDIFSPAIDFMSGKWQLIARYVGDVNILKNKYSDIDIIPLLNGYAIIFSPKDIIAELSNEPEIIYLEKPRPFYYQSFTGRQSACINSAQNRYRDSLSGIGTYIAIIDSGIDYLHPDFRNEDGSTRIKFLWDQTIPSDSSSTLVPFGSLYDETSINEAISSNITDRFNICPSIDISGHGTHVAGIAAGNGRASDGQYRGVAYQASLIIVKLAPNTNTSFPSTVQIMTAVDFCVRMGLKLKAPVSINLSFGNSDGSHSGSSLLETYLNSLVGLYQICIVIGSGNEGNSAGHASFLLSKQQVLRELSIGDFTPKLSLMIWKRYWDNVLFTITSPYGESITITANTRNNLFSLSKDNLFVLVTEPSPYNIFQEIFIEFIPLQSPYISSGIWTINCILEASVNYSDDSKINMWLPVSATRSQATRFLNPDTDLSLTIPSTATKVISVGAYDAATNRIAAFSGRGYTWGNVSIKPDLVAPGVDVISCSPGGGYTSRSGTSMATPFVTGCCASLMQWGILLKNNPYLYGEKMKAFLINGAKLLPGETSFPSPIYGWGALCLNDVITK